MGLTVAASLTALGHGYGLSNLQLPCKLGVGTESTYKLTYWGTSTLGRPPENQELARGRRSPNRSNDLEFLRSRTADDATVNACSVRIRIVMVATKAF